MTDHVQNVIDFLQSIKRDDIGGIAFSLVKPNGDVAQMSAIRPGAHVPLLGMMMIQQHQIAALALESLTPLQSSATPQDLN